MQHQGWLSRTKRILLNDTGQMTVFVALIFQVLFVFFAMVINIGLIVHDKINLQNAVDLAAYYGAERQAEILNEIAHVNYQIRQDYKLLTWRYRVLGTLGRSDGGRNTVPPTMENTAFQFDEVVNESPSVCVANNHWAEVLKDSPDQENYCFQPIGAGTIHRIGPLPIVAPFVPGVEEAALQIVNLADNQDVSFKGAGPWNWAFAAQMMEAYKLSIASRKAVIQQLRKQLVSPAMVDQNSQSVFEGVLHTLTKNLTLSNSTTLQQDSFSFINGLANSSCAQNNGAKSIVEIRTAPDLMFTYPLGDSSSFGISSAPIDDPTVVDGLDLRQVDPQGALKFFTKESNSDDLDTENGLLSSSLGFEKNPWCMAYVGVHVKTQPRKPFAPFGKPVTLEARAFAQPFGGRIGPWYKRSWSPNSDTSDVGDKVDPRESDRYLPGVDMAQREPNYSRFPGDAWGLRAKASQAAERKLLMGYTKPGALLSFQFYSHFEEIPQSGDPLAYNQGNLNENIRRAETIAVAPDAFDITYYSVDPNYGQNYKILNENGSRFPDLGTVLGQKIVVPPDIGGRNGPGGLPLFSVADQIELSKGDSGIDASLRGSLPFLVRDFGNLLTGWAPNAAQNFQFPSTRFAHCSTPASKLVMIPGGCAQGGRTGYSVRLIALDHLLSKKWSVGGDGVAPAGILNPPKDGF